jgi:hypothetical protein
MGVGSLISKWLTHRGFVRHVGAKNYSSMKGGPKHFGNRTNKPVFPTGTGISAKPDLGGDCNPFHAGPASHGAMLYIGLAKTLQSSVLPLACPMHAPFRSPLLLPPSFTQSPANCTVRASSSPCKQRFRGVRNEPFPPRSLVRDGQTSLGL